ncbi:unnamed protein product [Brassica rapa]|uniref:Diacylglycerol O-acyltransferase n=1 Tax=Brassica campestris TaxID=3711 RepID=A0A8D9DMX2_BRACM|nr:unnamed protein product [Brassica rapa]
MGPNDKRDVLGPTANSAEGAHREGLTTTGFHYSVPQPQNEHEVRLKVRRTKVEEASCQAHAPRPRWIRRRSEIGKLDLANPNPKSRLPPLLPFDEPRRYSKDSLSLTASPTQRPDFYSWTIEGVKQQSFSSSKTWSVLRERQQTCPWFNAVWFKGHTPKHAFNMWVAVQNRLPTRTRLASWGMLIPTVCCLCSTSDESRDHLFVDCSYIKILWDLLLRKLSESHITFTSWLQLLCWSSSDSSRSPRTLRSIAVQAVVYYTWIERNNRVYKNQMLPASDLFKLVDKTVRNTISARKTRKQFKNLMRMTDEEEEPLSPMARVFQSPDVDYCVVTIMGFKTKICPDVLIDALKHNVSKLPRFSTKLTENGAKWIEAKINVQDHVAVPYIDPEEIGEDGQGFVDDYISRLTMIPLDRSRPLWDIHILNVKTSDAEAVGVIRSHHSLGDGMSLISLMLACTHKTLDPQNTAIPSLKRRETVLHGLRKQGWFLRLRCTVCSIATLLWNTLVDMLLLLATVLFLKDTKTPLTGGEDTGRNRKRFYHRVISLDDIKLIKNAMNMSINDVLVGVTQATLSRYLSRLYVNEQGKNNEEDDGALTSYPNRLPDRLRFRAACAVNLRSDIGFKPLADMMAKDSKGRWGNYFSFIILPLSIGLQTDPLVYLKLSKATMARKKHSYHAALVYFIIKMVLMVFGTKAAATLFNQPVKNLTACVSNVVGPMDEISFRGHPIAYIAFSSYGHSQALLVHYISYAGKMMISLAVDPTIIPNPHKICDDMEQSLKAMKAALWERGLL